MINSETIWLSITCLFIVGLFVFFIVMCIKDDKYRKKTAKEEAKQPKESFPEPVTESFFARVSDLSCSARMVGTKSPKTVKEFLITLTTDDGNDRIFSVPEEYYEGFEIGQSGIATLSNGELYSFETETE